MTGERGRTQTRESVREAGGALASSRSPDSAVHEVAIDGRRHAMPEAEEALLPHDACPRAQHPSLLQGARLPGVEGVQRRFSLDLQTCLDQIQGIRDCGDTQEVSGTERQLTYPPSSEQEAATKERLYVNRKPSLLVASCFGAADPATVILVTGW